MRDFLNIGSSPVEESCAQLGSKEYDYHSKARVECGAFLRQLRRVFGDEPFGARLAVKGFPHDFGTYYEVVCHYDDSIPETVEYAFRLEGETPAQWDEQARAELQAVEVCTCGHCRCIHVAWYQGCQRCINKCIRYTWPGDGADLPDSHKPTQKYKPRRRAA